MSIFDLRNNGAGRQTTSTGISNGTLTDSSPEHALENNNNEFESDEDDDDDRGEVLVITETNASSGENEAMATVTVKRVVHVAA